MYNAIIVTSKNMKKDMCSPAGACSPVYFFGMIGAAVYWIGTATTFWTGVLGFLKALVWPALLVHDILQFIA